MKRIYNNILCENSRRNNTFDSEIVDSNLREADSLISSNRRVVSACSLRSDIDRTIRLQSAAICWMAEARKFRRKEKEKTRTSRFFPLENENRLRILARVSLPMTLVFSNNSLLWKNVRFTAEKRTSRQIATWKNKIFALLIAKIKNLWQLSQKVSEDICISWNCTFARKYLNIFLEAERNSSVIIIFLEAAIFHCLEDRCQTLKKLPNSFMNNCAKPPCSSLLNIMIIHLQTERKIKREGKEQLS